MDEINHYIFRCTFAHEADEEPGKGSSGKCIEVTELPVNTSMPIFTLLSQYAVNMASVNAFYSHIVEHSSSSSSSFIHHY